MPPPDKDGDSIADPTSTTTPPPPVLVLVAVPTLSSADKAEEGAATSALPPMLLILVPPPALLLLPRGVMARCCFSRICLILAARREAIEAFEDMLGAVGVYLVC